MVEVHHEKIVLAAGFDLPLPSFQPSNPDVRAMHLGLKHACITPRMDHTRPARVRNVSSEKGPEEKASFFLQQRIAGLAEESHYEGPSIPFLGNSKCTGC